MAARDWKFESVTYGLTWVGARDTCVSKKKGTSLVINLMFSTMMMLMKMKRDVS